MAREVGDLWPSSSGSASLGVEQIDAYGGFSREIRPFAHVHANSGVFHDALYGTSGVIRYNQRTVTDPGFEVSTNGGHSFNLNFGSNSTLSFLRASGELFIRSTGRLHIEADARIDINNSFGNLNIQPNVDFEVDAQHNATLMAFAQSGRLTYRFGPYQAWAWKPSFDSTGGPAKDGFWPLPHSGQILQMILANGGGGAGLQNAYNADPTILTNGTIPVTIIANNHVGMRLTPVGETAGIPLSLSGFIQRPTTSVENTGDIFMFRTGFGADGRPQRANITTDAAASARSLGPGMMSINTGSGIAPVSYCSGICQFFNLNVVTLSEDTAVNPILWHEAGRQFKDAYYHITTSDAYVTMLVPGFYKAEYKVQLSKTTGLQRTTISSNVTLNGSEIFGSTASTYLRNTVDKFNTVNGACLFNAESNDRVAVNVWKETNVNEGVSVAARKCALILTYLGPPRGGISTA